MKLRKDVYLSLLRRYEGKEVMGVGREDRVKIFPRDVDLTKYVDSVEADVKNFEDYHELRRELKKLEK